MATATSTITPVLTPSQQAAREFWRQAGADGMPPFYVMSQYYAQLSANSDNLPAVTAALEQLLTGLGYATDVDTVFAELAAGQGEELGYWAGRYCLFDSDGNRFDLVVGRDGATLTVPPALVDITSLPAGTDMASVTVLNSVGFSDGVLQLANANALLPRNITLLRLQASLSFTLPVSEDTLDAGAAAFQSTAPLCKGTFVVSGGGSPGLRPVNGKRGAWTQAGVNQAVDGDPASAWYGQYVLLEVTDVTAVKQEPKPVYIYDDPAHSDPDPRIGGLTFRWGQDGDPDTKYSGKVTYNNNVLQCPEDSDPDTQYAMQFMAPQVGAAEINLTVTTKGVVRSYKGYWVGSYPPPSPASQAHLATRPMTAVYSTASGASAGGYSKPIDVSRLTAGATNKIALLDGAAGNTYALTLNLTNCVATDTFSWAVTNNPNGRAAITLTGDQTAQLSLNNLSDSDVGQQLQVTVELTNNSAKPAVAYTLLFDIKVIQCGAISLAPPVLPPVVVGTPYSQNLTASGANGNFTWSMVSSSLPRSLAWDESSHQLSGTVTDASQIGKAFSLVVGLAASDVIMDPLTTSRPITVQSGATVAGSSMPPWEMRLILLGSGLAIAALGSIALSRLLRGKANAKTVDAIEAGRTIIESRIGRDPKSVGKDVLLGRQSALRNVKHDMPSRLYLIEELQEACTTLNHNIDAAEALYARLVQYRGEHLIFEPGEAVDPKYDDLIKAGYTTEAEINQGIVNQTTLVDGYREQIENIVAWGNNMRIRNEADQNEINEDTRSKSEDEHFLSLQ